MDHPRSAQLCSRMLASTSTACQKSLWQLITETIDQLRPGRTSLEALSKQFRRAWLQQNADNRHAMLSVDTMVTSTCIVILLPTQADSLTLTPKFGAFHQYKCSRILVQMARRQFNSVIGCHDWLAFLQLASLFLTLLYALPLQQTSIIHFDFIVPLQPQFPQCSPCPVSPNNTGAPCNTSVWHQIVMALCSFNIHHVHCWWL